MRIGRTVDDPPWFVTASAAAEDGPAARLSAMTSGGLSRKVRAHAQLPQLLGGGVRGLCAHGRGLLQLELQSFVVRRQDERGLQLEQRLRRRLLLRLQRGHQRVQLVHRGVRPQRRGPPYSACGCNGQPVDYVAPGYTQSPVSSSDGCDAGTPSMDSGTPADSAASDSATESKDGTTDASADSSSDAAGSVDGASMDSGGTGEGGDS